MTWQSAVPKAARPLSLEIAETAWRRGWERRVGMLEHCAKGNCFELDATWALELRRRRPRPHDFTTLLRRPLLSAPMYPLAMADERTVRSFRSQCALSMGSQPLPAHYEVCHPLCQRSSNRFARYPVHAILGYGHQRTLREGADPLTDFQRG